VAEVLAAGERRLLAGGEQAPIADLADVGEEEVDLGRVVERVVDLDLVGLGGVVDNLKRLRKAERRLRQELGRPATPEELSEATGLGLKKVTALLDIVDDPVSLDVGVGDGDSDIADLVEDPHAVRPDQRITEGSVTRDLADALDQLHDQERRVVELRFGLDGEGTRTLDEVSAELGCTRERVRQVEGRALSTLAKASPELREYLAQTA
ncbi:MAG: sigma-70 family RNA polymerase sigma factor, partial [Actinomycetota bacterium]